MAESTSTTTRTTPSGAASKAATTRKTNATKRSTAAKKAAGTRAANRGAAARGTAASKTKASATRARTTAARKAAATEQDVKTPIARATELASSAVLVPVGAALIARDGITTTVSELKAKYGTKAKAKRELNRFERRGASALKGVDKTRTKVERELRERTTRIEDEVKSIVNDIETRAEPVAKNVELVTARVENAYEGGRTAVTKASTTVQERIAALA
jgi:prefoldin subunit 5